MNEKYGYKVWVPSKHPIMKLRNVDFRPQKIYTTNNAFELEFHPPEDDRHDVNRQSACEDIVLKKTHITFLRVILKMIMSARKILIRQQQFFAFFVLLAKLNDLKN